MNQGVLKSTRRRLIVEKSSVTFQEIDQAVGSGAVFTKTETELQELLDALIDLRPTTANSAIRAKQCRRIIESCLRSWDALSPLPAVPVNIVPFPRTRTQQILQRVKASTHGRHTRDTAGVVLWVILGLAVAMLLRSF
jgi:hypothetical protein